MALLDARKYCWPCIDTLVDEVKSSKVTSTELVKKSLQIIEQTRDFNVVISVLEESALKRAKEIDEDIVSGKPVGKLAGVPFVAKDNFLVFGSETTAASNMLKGFTAPYQATAIQKLESEGAICVAKVNLDAFAHGGSTENSDFFVTKNPHNDEYVPGGSSGGSATAVALGIAPFALGTDTGGSIRLPAHFCGVVGLKPTYGLVSRSGVVAMASSTDCIGPLSWNVSDSQIVLDVMAGKDSLDATTIDRDESYMQPKFDIKNKKIGIISQCITDELSEATKKAIDATIAHLQSQGAVVESVSIPTVHHALAVYYVVVPAEVSSNLARYDGQRFGYSSEAETLDESYELSRSQGFGPEAKRRIMIGTHVLSSGYYDAYYKKAQTVRTKLINEFAQVFSEYDFLIAPTAVDTAFKIGQNTSDPLKMYLNDVMTVSANLVGIPAISVPVSSDNGLPIGLQLLAQQKCDGALLEFSKIVEKGAEK